MKAQNCYALLTMCAVAGTASSALASGNELQLVDRPGLDEVVGDTEVVGLPLADRAIELKKMPEAYMNRALARQGLRQYEAALEDYGRAIALRKTDASAYYNRASLRIERGEIQEALADYDRAIELRPDYAAALMNRGSVRDQLGQTAAAIADYEQCLKVTPKNWPKRAMVEELWKRAKAK